MRVESIAVLLAAGRHPLTARPRRADADARALELALAFAARCGARVLPVHAGAADEPSLRDYLGMGAPTVTALDVAADQDPAPALIAWLAEARPTLVLAGDAHTDGFGSGMTPFLAAQALRLPIVSNICALELEKEESGGGFLVATQALERGARRRLAVRDRCIFTVGEAGPSPRQPAFAKARAGRVRPAPNPAQSPLKGPYSDVYHTGIQPAAPRRKRLDVVDPNASAAERLRMATEMSAKGGEVLTGLSPEAAARRILEEAKAAGLVRSPHNEERQTP